MNRRDCLRMTGVGILAEAGGRLAGRAMAADAVTGGQAGRMNVIFILAYDIGYGDFGCYGATKIQTPNIDRMAAEGHLGLGATAPTDYNGEIKPGPLEVGFDECFIIPATGDRTPYCRGAC